MSASGSTPRRALRGTLAALLCVGALARPAWADGATAQELLDQARAKVDEVDYEAARGLIDRGLQRGGLVIGELARAHRFAGEVAAALGDIKSARAHFVMWIMLDPSAALAPGVSPKIEAAFAQAQTDAKRNGGFKIDGHIARGPGLVRVSVDGHDPMKMVTRLKIHVAGGAEIDVHGLTAELPLADTQPAAIELHALDEHGNELWSGELHAEPSAAPVQRGLPTWARWPTWTIVAVASGGAAGYFGWQTGRDEEALKELNANSTQHSFDDALEIQHRGERNALLANVMLGVAGAAAVAAVLTKVLDTGGVELQPTVSGSGGGVSASLHF